MTPSVNLLPARYVERLAERRWAVLTGATLLVLVAVLALVALAQSRELGRAQDDRDEEQAESGRLQAQRRQLAPFRELADGIVARERLLTAALETQISWAALLSNVALTLPSDASLTSFNAESALAPFGAAPAAEVRDSLIIGSTTLKGYSVQEFTPGVERTLQLLATVEGLAEPRLQVGTADKIGESPVTTFEGTTFIDGAALTRRYADGLPPERDVDVPPLGGAGPGRPAGRGTGTGGAT